MRPVKSVQIKSPSRIKMRNITESNIPWYVRANFSKERFEITQNNPQYKDNQFFIEIRMTEHNLAVLNKYYHFLSKRVQAIVTTKKGHLYIPIEAIKEGRSVKNRLFYRFLTKSPDDGGYEQFYPKELKPVRNVWPEGFEEVQQRQLLKRR